MPCPICGTPFTWPPSARCATCSADLQGPVAAALWQVARDEAELHTRRRELREQLSATALPPPPPPPAPAVQRSRGLGDVGAQTMLGLAGAALLALAAVFFAAVTWQDLSTGVRSAILTAATGGVAVTAVQLEKRRLRVTAGSLGLLSAALTATLVWALHTFGATGGLSDAGGTALAAVTAAAVAVGLHQRGIVWQAGAAATAWLIAVASTAKLVIDATPDPALPLVLLAAAAAAAAPVAFGGPKGPRAALVGAGAVALASASVVSAAVAATTDGAPVALPVAAGVAAAVLWWHAGGRTWGTAAATATATGLSVGVLATLELRSTVLMAAVAAVTLATVAVAGAVGERRLPLLLGAAPVAVPTAVWTGAAALSAAADVSVRAASAWQRPPPAAEVGGAFVAAGVVLAVSAGVAAVAQLRPRRTATVLLAAGPPAVTTALWHLGGHPALLAAAALTAGVAGALRPGRTGRLVLAVWLPVAVAWVAPSPAESAVVAGLAAALAGAALAAPVGRHLEHVPLAVVMAAFAAASTVAALPPEVWTPAAAGVAAVAAAVAVGVAGRWLDLDAAATSVSVGAVGGAAAVLTGAVDGEVDAAVVTGALAVGAVLLATAQRRTPTAARISGSVAAAAATVTSWLLVHDAGVDITEAYTVVPAALALGAGAAWMWRDAAVPSARALQPGLALAIVPTAVALLADPTDLTRALVTALIAVVTLLVGVAWRIAAPVRYGAGAAAVVIVTQLVPRLVELGAYVPRWVTFGVLGVLLVAASTTFERQRLRARRIGGHIRDMADEYR